MQTAAAAIARDLEILHASTNGEINTAFEKLVQKRVDALLFGANNLFQNRRVQLVTLAIHHKVPAIWFGREFVEAGGLMSYGYSLTDQYRQAGIYVGRILKGDKPADLPVMRPTRFEFVINLQTARLLGLDFPPTLLSIADEVIEWRPSNGVSSSRSSAARRRGRLPHARSRRECRLSAISAPRRRHRQASILTASVKVSRTEVFSTVVT